MSVDSLLEITGFSVGLLYLWWEYHADSRVWLASVIMPAISMWIYFSKGLYADFGINIYYLLIAIYGFRTWTKKTKDNHGVEKQVNQIAYTPLWAWVTALFSAGLLWLGIWWILENLTDSTVPIADAFTTAMSIVGLWMMARKYLEQWFVWLIVDVVCCGLYFYKGIYFYCGLYGVYTVIAVFGYLKWRKLMAEPVIRRIDNV